MICMFRFVEDCNFASNGDKWSGIVVDGTIVVFPR